jgi:succinyl-diaminopimelate desuccinylase
MFREEGFLTERDPEGHFVLASYGEGERTVGIFAHADVVPVGDDWVTTQPFEPILKDGVMYGRGVDDNKAGVIGTLYAVEALRAAGVPLRRRLTMFVGGSEETGGMTDVQSFVEHERQPKVCLVPDSGFPVSVGEKGILHALWRSKKPLQEVTRFNGGQAYNVVLDRVEAIDRAVDLAYASDGECVICLVGRATQGLMHENGKLLPYPLDIDLLTKSIARYDKDVSRG